MAGFEQDASAVPANVRAFRRPNWHLKRARCKRFIKVFKTGSSPNASQKAPMTSFALIVKHQTLPGKRDEVRNVWEKHMAPAIAANPSHTAYFYCFDNSDPDSICAFQMYASVEASQEFIKTSSYAAYLREVEPLLAGPPQVTALTPVWSKGA